MGKLEVSGTAQRIVDYDLMKIVIDFHAKEDTSDMASKRVMKECEDFLAQLKKGGFDLSAVSLRADQIRQTYSYRNDEQVECYEANRELEFVCEFNMKLINDIRIITNRMKSKANFKVSYLLSKENAIMKELLKEALMDAKNQATMLASAIDQKVIGLISADKNDPKADDVYLGQVLSMSLCCEQDSDENYDNSDELAPTKVTLAEQIYTVWEVE